VGAAKLTPPPETASFSAHRMSDLETHQRQDSNSQRTALIGLAICAVLVLGGLLLVYELKKTSELQDCVMQGRTNCAPIDAATSGD